MSRKQDEARPISRREFMCGFGGVLAGADWPRFYRGEPRPVGAKPSDASMLPAASFPVDHGWLFGGKLQDRAALEPGFHGSALTPVTLPHCVAKLSWQNWDPAAWEDVWVYRRRLTIPRGLEAQRFLLHFDGVMVGVTPVLNGHALPKHVGGYLPFEYEITHLLHAGENVLALALDCRWSNAPPEGSPLGPRSIDYLEPGGMVRSVRLRAVPQVFLRDLFAKPVDVLAAGRHVEITCSLDAAWVPPTPLQLQATLEDGQQILARDSRSVRIERTGETHVGLTLSSLGNIALWHPDSPRLYDVNVTLSARGKSVDSARTRIGFRAARFEVDGFFLNGKRFRIFGLDRHELFPYTGFAMPPRVMRRDAEILRHQFNCNFVRCSHYPQSEAFLDACDELGLMVWEELPGWQYIGSQAWQELAIGDVKQMVRRDRNHPAVVIWGVRINESANDPILYRKTRETAKSLDDSRPTSGTMTRLSTVDWLQDVFAYDDYHARPDGSVGIAEPLPGVPYLVTEAVGQFNYAARKGFNSKYQRAGDLALQETQAILHAQAHDRGAAWPRLAGVVAWCAFDYGSLINSYGGVKWPGVADIFRIPKLGASFYKAQVDPKMRAVIEPDFYWDFGPQSPSGPGKHAAIFSNCDRLELFLSGKHQASLRPDRKRFPRLMHPPFFADLRLDGNGHPELRIDGYVGESLILSRSFSSDRAQDQLLLRADDAKLVGDGIDATRLLFQAADKYGAPRAFVDGAVTLKISGPGLLVGDNPFELGANGGAGAVWVKTRQGRGGRIRVAGWHPRLGLKSVEIEVVQGCRPLHTDPATGQPGMA